MTDTRMTLMDYGRKVGANLGRGSLRERACQVSQTGTELESEQQIGAAKFEPTPTLTNPAR